MSRVMGPWLLPRVRWTMARGGVATMLFMKGPRRSGDIGFDGQRVSGFQWLD
jgi:hypothetical protein